MEQVRKTYAWQEAMKLSQELLRICEEFSDSDRNVLAGHLRQAVVDIPATVASDVVLNQGPTLQPIVRLATNLDLIHKVYPAIETGKAPEQVKALMERMQSVNYRESEPEPESESESADVDPMSSVQPISITPTTED